MAGKIILSYQGRQIVRERVIFDRSEPAANIFNLTLYSPGNPSSGTAWLKFNGSDNEPLLG